MAEAVPGRRLMYSVIPTPTAGITHAASMAGALAAFCGELIDGTAGRRSPGHNLPEGDDGWWADYRARLEKAARQ
ncbi:MAG: hypothetical protein ABW022_03865 [Actinoplanes sp.]